MRFPFRKYSKKELLHEYERLRNVNVFELKRSTLGYKCSNAFFQKERMQSSSLTKLSGIEYWKKHKEYVIEYCKNTNKKDVFNAIQFLNHIPSQFPPMIAAYMYKLFKATTVLDPFAGWGDRCIAAMAFGVNYIGIDSNKDLKDSYTSMINFYTHDCNVRMIYKPCEKVNLDRLSFDMVFSSPPFWEESGQISETYKHMPCKDLASFIDDVFVPMLVKCMSRGVWCDYMASVIPIKWKKCIEYKGSGNKKNQIYSIYCY